MRKKERIVKTRAGWRKEDQVQKLHIWMTVIAVTLCISVAVGGTLAWLEIKKPLEEEAEEPISSLSEEETLPAYPNPFNLVLVNSTTPLPQDFSIQLEKLDGYSFEKRILPALKKMKTDAKKDGCELRIGGGYLSAEEQDALFEKGMQELVDTQGYTRARAEDQMQKTLGRGGFNESQTGMSVLFVPEQEGSSFTQTPEYKWLLKNSVNYGFTQRYPDGKTMQTGMAFNPALFRYVGTDNATKMREYSMCLEEYAQYVNKQPQG